MVGSFLDFYSSFGSEFICFSNCYLHFYRDCNNHDWWDWFWTVSWKLDDLNKQLWFCFTLTLQKNLSDHNLPSSAASFLFATEMPDIGKNESLIEEWDLVEHPTFPPPPSQTEDVEHWTRAMFIDATKRWPVLVSDTLHMQSSKVLSYDMLAVCISGQWFSFIMKSEETQL